jgi:hypothetical protein
MKDEFNTSIADSQGTRVVSMKPQDFDIDEYSDYEFSLLEGCRAFWEKSEGVAVYRRFRVPDVFSWACADRTLSLELQLAALKKSMAFKMDIPNFLEPWYGIGVVSSAFAVPYLWKDGQAPAVEGPFMTAREALDHRISTVAESEEGRKVLEMIEYFLDQTKGRIPISLGDTQSPLNIVSSYLMDSTAFMYEMFDNPDDLKELLNTVGQMEKEFIDKQRNLIGNSLVRPGHGFASSRSFEGLGFSDDNILMFSDEAYKDFAIKPMLRAAEGFKGPVFHSCGNWSGRADLIKSIPSLIMADGAVGNQTDPLPNDPAVLGKAFADSSILLHTRIVGDPETVLGYFDRLRHDGLKCIVTTYCESPEDQSKVYDGIHARY